MTYYPIDGAIEYIFNTIQRDLEIKLPEIMNEGGLRNAVYDTVGVVVDFVEYSEMLGMEY